MKSASERAPEGMHAWSALKRDSYTIQPPCLDVFFFSKEASGMTKTKHQDKWYPKMKLNRRFRILSRIKILRFFQNNLVLMYCRGKYKTKPDVFIILVTYIM